MNMMRMKTVFRKSWVLVLAAAALPGFVSGEEKKDSPVLTAVKSLKLSGYVQVLGVDWNKDVDSFSLRRARLSLAGDVIKNLKFKVQLDFVKSPSLLDAIVEYEPSKAAGLRVGQFTVPFSLENVTPTPDVDTVNRSLVEESLAPGRDNSASGRDVGIAVYGTWSFLEYTAGLFNGAGINKSDTNDHKDFSGRVVVHPFKFLALGGSLYRGKQSASSTAPLVTRNKEGLEAAFLLSGFSLKSEYIHARDGAVSKSGAYIQAGYFVVPGKWQGILKYDTLDGDRSVAGDGKRMITLGVNWIIAGRTRLQLNYEIHRLEGGGTEKSGILAQLQTAF